MTNALFTAYRAVALEPSGTLGTTAGTNVRWATDDIKCVLVDHGTDTPAPTTDSFLSDIGAGARVATSANLSGKTTTGGIADANDVTFSAVSGASVESVVIYKDTGTASTSLLIAYIDTATGLPVTPSGGDIIVAWANTTNRIFLL